MTEPPHLVVVEADEPVWWVVRTDGRLYGRWDDRKGNWRTVYAGSALLACLLEVLAGFRPDPTSALELDDIVEDDEDATMHPTALAGEISYSWLEPRSAASATLTGHFCPVAAAD